MKKIFVFIFVLISLCVYANDIDYVTNLDNTKEFKNERVALIIGVTKYQSVKTSQYIDSDCTKIKNILEKNGSFTIKYLSNNSDIKPTKKNIIDSLNEIKKNSENIKTFLLYYAGFSFSLDDVNYLAPTDTDFNNPKNSAISIENILNILTEINQKSKVAVFFDYGRMNLNSFMGAKYSLPEIPDKEYGFSVLYSSNGTTPSYDSEEYKSSVFSYYLIKAFSDEKNITNYGNNDGSSSLNEICSYVVEQLAVWSLNNKPDAVQEPVFTTIKGGDFVITQMPTLTYKVKSLDFYDTKDPKKIRKSFDIDTLTFVGFNLDLDIRPSFYENMTLKAIFIYPDGSIMGEVKKDFKKTELEKDKIIWNKKYGFKSSGYWKAGKYRFEVYLNSEKIEESFFNVK
ncbi:MAG TPA: caspase family protein [Spirochaetota bacterium]|nr:caspase family protein [Spirochaetota bacterium]